MTSRVTDIAKFFQGTRPTALHGHEYYYVRLPETVIRQDAQLLSPSPFCIAQHFSHTATCIPEILHVMGGKAAS